MAPKRWTTEAELKFLEGQYQSYLDHKARKDLSHFWNPVSFEFFKQFPEKKKLFGSEAAMLTPEQTTELTNAIARRGEQIIHWFRNEGNKGHRRARDAAKVKGLKLVSLSKPAGRRRLQPVEIYSRKYYETKIKPLVAAEIERNHLGKQQTLAVIKRVTREVFENEGEEVKAEIQAEIDAHHAAEDAEKVDGEPSPLQRQLALDNAPTILREFLHELSCKTGWCFTVLGGGPAPQERGELRTISIHEGKTVSGHTFADSIDVKARCIKPFAEFIAAVYPKEIRSSYAIDAPQNTASNNPKPSEGRSSESEAELASSTGLGESPSPRCDMRHSSLPASPHLNSEFDLSDSLDLHSDSHQTTAGLMLDTSGRPPASPAGTISSMPTTDLGREKAAPQELQALLPEAEGNSNAILDPFPYDFSQLEDTDLTSIVLSPRSMSLLDDLFPDSAHPLDVDRNVTQNRAIRSGGLLPANARFDFNIEPSGSSAQLPSQLLTPTPPASFISASPASVVSSPSTAFASALSAGPTALTVISVPQPSESVDPPQHPQVAPSLPGELFNGEPNAGSDTSACATPAPSAFEPQVELPSTRSGTLQPPQVPPPVTSEILQSLQASFPIASEPGQPVDVTSSVTSETQPFSPVSSLTTSTGARTRPARNRRAPPRPDATPPPLSRHLPSGGAERSTVENVESNSTVEAEKEHGKGRAKGKENAADAEVKQPSGKRAAASRGGRKAKKVRI